MASARLYTKQDERIEAEVDKHFEQLKYVAGHEKIAGTLAAEEVVTHKKSVDVNGQVQTIEDQELVPLHFPKTETIAECKRSRDVMKIFATPFKGYLLKELAVKDTKDYIVPTPITLFICYRRRLRNLNLPILNDSGNKIKEGIEAFESMLTKKFWREINSHQPEAQMIVCCQALFDQGANINRWFEVQEQRLDIDSVDILLDTGPIAPGKKLSSPLSLAAQYHLNNLLTKLLEWGADETCQQDALLCAVKNENQAGIRILLEKIHAQKRLEPKVIDDIFSHTISKNTLSILKEFITYFPTDFEKQKKLIDDALHYGFIDIARYLLDFFKINYLQNPKTNNPDDWLKPWGQYLKSLITIYGVDNIMKLCPTLAHKMLYRGGISFLVEAKADLNIARERDGMTPLMVAAQTNTTESVALLLKQIKTQESKIANNEFKTHIDVNQQDKRGYTALMHTIAADDFRKNEKTVRLLLEHNAELNIEAFSLQEDQKSAEKLNKNVINPFMLEFNKPWPTSYQEKIYGGRFGSSYVKGYKTCYTDGLSLDLLKLLYEKMDKKFVEKLYWELLEEGNYNKLGVFVHLWGPEKLAAMRNDQNETPLIAALRLNHFNYADNLLELAKIPVNAPKGHDLFGALIHFARVQNEAACRFLIKRGASIADIRVVDRKAQEFFERLNPPTPVETYQCRIL